MIPSREDTRSKEVIEAYSWISDTNARKEEFADYFELVNRVDEHLQCQENVTIVAEERKLGLAEAMRHCRLRAGVQDRMESQGMTVNDALRAELDREGETIARWESEFNELTATRGISSLEASRIVSGREFVRRVRLGIEESATERGLSHETVKRKTGEIVRSSFNADEMIERYLSEGRFVPHGHEFMRRCLNEAERARLEDLVGPIGSERAGRNIGLPPELRDSMYNPLDDYEKNLLQDALIADQRHRKRIGKCDKQFAKLTDEWGSRIDDLLKRQRDAKIMVDEYSADDRHFLARHTLGERPTLIMRHDAIGRNAIWQEVLGAEDLDSIDGCSDIQRTPPAQSERSSGGHPLSDVHLTRVSPASERDASDPRSSRLGTSTQNVSRGTGTPLHEPRDELPSQPAAESQLRADRRAADRRDRENEVLDGVPTRRRIPGTAREPHTVAPAAEPMSDSNEAQRSSGPNERTRQFDDRSRSLERSRGAGGL